MGPENRGFGPSNARYPSHLRVVISSGPTAATFPFPLYFVRLLQILLQSPQPLLGLIQHIVRLAHRETQVILHNARMLILAEL